MLAGLARISCLHCGQPLGPVVPRHGYLTCRHCHTRYPVVDERVPVLLAEPLRELATAYFLHDQHLRETTQTVQRLEALAQQQPAAGPRLLALARGHALNAASFRQLQDALRPFVLPDHLLAACRENTASAYAVLLSYYLEKDWSGQPATEQELAIKLAPVLAHSRAYAPDLASVLVLGAGAGRVAWELGYVYEQVYGVDNSLLMPYNFGRLQTGPIPFASLRPNNVLDAASQVRTLTASLHACAHEPATFAANAARITYFMGDATRLPLPDASQSAIVSVYFTDVLPLRLYLAEVRRLLKPGGVFIHVGPLIYHFEDESQMLPPEQVLAVFRESGFTIQATDFTTSPSALAAGTMVSTSYINWVFTAVRTPGDWPLPLTLEAVLSLSGPLSYELRGQLAPAAAPETGPVAYLRVSTGKQLKISALLLDLLRLLDGSKSLRQVLALLEEDYELPEQAYPALLTSLRQLQQEGLLTSI